MHFGCHWITSVPKDMTESSEREDQNIKYDNGDPSDV